jgi:hypothetical protein
MPRLSPNLYADPRTDGGGTVPAVERQREERQMYELGEITAPEFYLRSLGNLSDATLGTIAEKTVGPAMEAAGSLFPPLGIIAEPVTRPIAATAEQYPRMARNVGAGLSAADLGLFGLGSVMRQVGSNIVDQRTGRLSGRGMELASLDNYIDNFYGIYEPSALDPKQAGAFRGLTDRERQLETQLYDADSRFNSLLDFAENGMLVPDSLRKKVRQFRKKIGQDTLKTKDFESSKETRAMAAKISTVAQFAQEGFKRTVKDLFSPESRALFREQGLTETGRRIIEAHMISSKFADSPEGKKILQQIAEKQQEYRGLDKPGGRRTEKHFKLDKEIRELGSQLPDRGIPKAVAEAIYQMHIGEQAGRRGGLNEGLAQIALESFAEPYNAYQRGTLSSWFLKNNQASSDKYDVSFSEGVSNRLEQNIINAHKDTLGETGVPALVVMKKAAKGKTSGNHLNDMLRVNKPGSPAYKINNAFKALEGRDVNQGTLIDELRRQNLTITGKEADGKVYFSGSTTGSAIVEGGIHVSGYVKPDGTTALIMSDVHDFFENIRPAKAVADQVIPNSLIAVTPPVFKNFRDPKSDISNKAPVEKDSQAVDVDVALEKIATAKPTRETVAAERMQDRGGMLIGAGLTSAAAKDEEQ